jgi:hypothetical protein
VKVGRQKLHCIERARSSYPVIAGLGRRARWRLGEVRRELALSLLKEGRSAQGIVSLLRSLVEDPRGVGELLRIGRRKVLRSGEAVP